MTGNLSLIRVLNRLVAVCLLLSAFLGCTPPPEKIHGSEVLAVESIAEVINCEFKGTIIAASRAKERQIFNGGEYQIESNLRSMLLTNAKNCVHELEGNRILARTILFKGTQQFDFFQCTKPSMLDAYTHEINARNWKQANMSRLCKNPGSAQRLDFSKYCKREITPNPPKKRITSEQPDKMVSEPEIISCR